jgi:hypothetical protein
MNNQSYVTNLLGCVYTIMRGTTLSRFGLIVSLSFRVDFSCAQVVRI